jgi:CheY-like chemotaxis protein
MKRRPIQILLVDDDHIHLEKIAQTLHSAFRGGNVELSMSEIQTESHFRARLDSFRDQPPDVVVMDIMLRWADPAEEIPDPPEEVTRDGFYNAGVRCLRLLGEASQTRQVPVVLYTVLEENDVVIPPEVPRGQAVFVKKQPDTADLVKKLESVLGLRAKR